MWRSSTEPRRPRSSSTPLATALLLAGCVSAPSQTYRSRYERFETGDVTTDALTNLVEVGIQERVGPDFEYRLADRVIQTQRTTNEPGMKASEFDTLLHNPSLDLRSTIGTLAWDQGFEIETTAVDSTLSSDNDMRRTELLQRLTWTPEEGLPQVTTWLNVRTLRDDLFFDQRNVESVFELRQDLGSFDYETTYQREDLTDDATQTETDREEVTLRGTWSEDFLDGDLSTTVRLFADERTTTFRFGSIPTQSVTPLAGLSLIDNTPQVAMLASTPALIDGQTGVSSGINIGGFASGGEINWNVGAELTTGDVVDEVRLITVDPVDALFRSDFRFSVWVSDDNDFWTQVTSSALYVYEELQRRFRITIPTVSSRYVKIVNTASPALAPAVLVSELQLVRDNGATPTSSSTSVDDSIHNATANAVWRAEEHLTLTFDTFVQSFETDREGQQTRDETRLETGVGALWAPHEQVDVAMRVEDRRRRDALTRNEDFQLASALTTYRPLEALDLSLSLTRTDRAVDGRPDLRTDAAQVSASAQLLDTLQVDLTAELSTQDDRTNLRQIDRTTFTAGLFAELTRALDLTLSLRNEDGRVTGPGAGGIPDPSEKRYEMVLLYRMRNRLTAQSQLEWVDTFAGRGLDQRYRLDWFPFRDGAINLQLDYDRTDTQSSGNEAIDRYRALMRWTMNPSAFFELTWNAQVPDASPRSEQVGVSLNVTL